MTQPLRTTFLPDWRRSNPYQSLLSQALGRQGVEVLWQQFKPGAFALNRLTGEAAKADVLHLHWINDLIGPTLWRRHAVLRVWSLLLLALDVLLVRARGKRVVWTVHNLVAHESPNPVAELRARRVLALTCSAVIVHSASALRRIEAAYGIRLSGKAHIIPHGNYEGCYPEDSAREEALRAQLRLAADDITLLFFGAIREYKGVLRLIEAFRAARNPRLRLVVAGSARPPTLEAQLLAAAEGDERIRLVLGFVDDRDVAPMFALADVVVIPFERALTSGSTVLAMTMGKATLLPEEARVFDLVDDESGLYFDSVSGLTASLETLDPEDLRRMGTKAGLAALSLRWDGIAAKLSSVYANGKRGAA